MCSFLSPPWCWRFGCGWGTRRKHRRLPQGFPPRLCRTTALPVSGAGGARRPEAGKPSLSLGFPHVLVLLAVLAGGYFLGYMGLICASGTGGDSRVVVPAGVFLPSLLTFWIVGQWEKVAFAEALRRDKR